MSSIVAVGTTFGWLTVEEKLPQSRWRVTCRCGTSKSVCASNLGFLGDGKTPKTHSCGCYRRKEGAINSYLYSYKYNAHKRGIEFRLGKIEFSRLITSSCHYCGEEPSATPFRGREDFVVNGIDRVDPNEGYTAENTVSACKCCNQMKSSLSVAEFLDKVHKIGKHQPSVEVTASGVARYHDYLLNFKNTSRTCPRKPEAPQNTQWHEWVDSARKRGLEFALPKSELGAWVSSDCFYCGIAPYKKFRHFDFFWNGLDRVNNSLGYTPENVVPCCAVCNGMKSTLDQTAFQAHIQRISGFQRSVR